MDILHQLAFGMSVAADPLNLLYCAFGVIFGIIIGALPGMGPSAGIAILLPLTYGMNPIAGIIMLAGIYYGAMYGGSITSILINTPGDSAAVMTVLDGYPLTRKGKSGKALGMAAIASTTGGIISIILFSFLAPKLAGFALRFGPPEYFALMAMGLTAIGGMTGKYPLKGYLSAFIGLFLGTVGLDLVTGADRFIFFGFRELYEGIDFIPVAIGLFGISEILTLSPAGDGQKIDKENLTLKKQLPSKEELKIASPHIFRGTILGFFVGMLPGAGATIASFMSYGMARKLSRRGEEFGTGVLEGVAAPESANNSAAIGAMVPMLTLGVPGSASTAIMMGALMMFGLRPGPLMFQKSPEFLWGLIGSMYIGNLFLLIIALLGVRYIVRILNVTKPVLNAVVLAFILVGAYCLNNSMFDIGLTFIFGIIGFCMKKLEVPAAPMVLSLVLGGMLETSLRQSLIISQGNPAIFFTRHLSLVFLIAALGMFLWPVVMKIKNSLKRKES